ncbi:hypothetical protein ACQP00_35500 [Dactylosporangium sp. CS-047395]|uniref:hypothetical protein n=1 Tax=Dactylosporangium sp. CS-047395 TaxID=3239936 RepID=UPI003D92A8BA
MSYTRYEFIDDVMTLTLAEGPGETGTVLRFKRGTWEAEPHEVSSGVGERVESAVRRWRMTGERLEIELHDVPAAQLGLGPHLELTVDAAPPRVSRVHRALADILLDVPERR